MLDVEFLRTAVARAREIGALLASDECYAELGWSGKWATEVIPSILDPRVIEGDLSGVLAVYSLSKQSNLAGYRAAFAVGDEELVKAIVNLRMHAGMITPWPVQQAMTVALGDDAHVEHQRGFIALAATCYCQHSSNMVLRSATARQVYICGQLSAKTVGQQLSAWHSLA